jgi:hypothetical protein
MAASTHRVMWQPSHSMARTEPMMVWVAAAQPAVLLGRGAVVSRYSL